jgi:hypothetical protein
MQGAFCVRTVSVVDDRSCEISNASHPVPLINLISNTLMRFECRRRVEQFWGVLERYVDSTLLGRHSYLASTKYFSYRKSESLLFYNLGGRKLGR